MTDFFYKCVHFRWGGGQPYLGHYLNLFLRTPPKFGYYYEFPPKIQYIPCEQVRSVLFYLNRLYYNASDTCHE